MYIEEVRVSVEDQVQTIESQNEKSSIGLDAKSKKVTQLKE